MFDEQEELGIRSFRLLSNVTHANLKRNFAVTIHKVDFIYVCSENESVFPGLMKKIFLHSVVNVWGVESKKRETLLKEKQKANLQKKVRRLFNGSCVANGRRRFFGPSPDSSRARRSFDPFFEMKQLIGRQKKYPILITRWEERSQTSHFK